MIEYKENPEVQIVELRVSGKITADEIKSAVGGLEATYSKWGKLKIYEEIGDLDGIEPAALWQDLSAVHTHRDKIAKVAVVSDKKWVEYLTEIADEFTSFEIEKFSRDEGREEAYHWLNQQEVKEHGTLKLRKDPRGFYEIIAKGNVSTVDYDAFVDQVEQVFATEQGKINIVKRIDDVEGINWRSALGEIDKALKMWPKVGKAAIVTDSDWLETLGEAINHVTSAEIKVFDDDEAEKAYRWISRDHV